MDTLQTSFSYLFCSASQILYLAFNIFSDTLALSFDKILALVENAHSTSLCGYYGTKKNCGEYFLVQNSPHFAENSSS